MTLAVKHLSYGSQRKQILTNISVTFEPGKIYGLLGRNGAGKSTLLNLISDRIPSGRKDITIDGKQLHKHDQRLQRLYLMSEVNLYPSSERVSKLFEMTGRLYGEFDWQRAHDLCKQFELDEQTRFGKLSTGYRTLFKDIVALCVPADYVLLDEPVLGLDANHREMFYQAIMDAQTDRPRTFIIATHLIEEISWLLDQAVIISDGRIKIDEDTETLTSRSWQITGAPEEVNAFLDGTVVVSKHHFGNELTAVVMTDETMIPESLTKKHINLQELFVVLTGDNHEA